MYCIFRGGHYVVERCHRTVYIPRQRGAFFGDNIRADEGKQSNPTVGMPWRILWAPRKHHGNLGGLGREARRQDEAGRGHRKALCRDDL